jgi:pyruvate formate lyase activating enzyme
MSDTDLEALDLVLLGIKSWGEARHKDLTGMDIAPTLAFAERLAALGKPVWIRFVLVPGLTDDPEIASGIAGFAAGLGNVQRVEVLPFHQLGRFKWERLGLEYTLDGVQPPSSELAERTCAIFRSAGLTAA